MFGHTQTTRVLQRLDTHNGSKQYKVTITTTATTTTNIIALMYTRVKFFAKLILLRTTNSEQFRLLKKNVESAWEMM